MISHQFYNVVHIVGLVLLMAALGGITLTAEATDVRPSGRTRRLVLVLHGVGAFLVLLGGFGMLARLGIVRGSTWPGWVWVKMGVWVTLLIAAFVPYRFPGTARFILLLLPILGGLAAYMAIYKPL
jgi:hypothetical protein